MEAKDKSLIDIMNENEKMKFIIPFFQRSYVWEEENWEALYDDVKENNNHFLGSIILKKDGTSNQKDIIDGQQRLTTLTLLLKAIFDQLDKRNKNKRKAACKSVLFGKNTRYIDGEEICEYYPRLCHSKYDRIPYMDLIGKVEEDDDGNENIISISDDELNKINENDHNIKKCYKYFRERLSKETEETKLKMINMLSSNNQHILVSIDLGQNDDEQTIFDTVNNSGKRLSVADIIKNKLFQKMLVCAIKILIFLNFGIQKHRQVELNERIWKFYCIVLL